MPGFLALLSSEAETILGFPTWRLSLEGYAHFFWAEDLETPVFTVFTINLFWNNLDVHRKIAKI